MSFMPNPGTKVRLLDGRDAIVTRVTPDGRGDRVRFDDGSEQCVTAWDIAEIVGTEAELEPAAEPVDVVVKPEEL